MITEESFKKFVEKAPSAVVVVLYSLSRLNEKYRVTAWSKNELTKRGFNENDVAEFSENFTNFYSEILEQNDL